MLRWVGGCDVVDHGGSCFALRLGIADGQSFARRDGSPLLHSLAIDIAREKSCNAVVGRRTADQRNSYRSKQPNAKEEGGI